MKNQTGRPVKHPNEATNTQQSDHRASVLVRCCCGQYWRHKGTWRDMPACRYCGHLSPHQQMQVILDRLAYAKRQEFRS